MDCETEFYKTAYRKSYGLKPGAKFAKIAPGKPQADPNIVPGYSVNNLKVRNNPTPSKTWERLTIENSPEELQAYLERIDSATFQRFFKDPEVDIDLLERILKEKQLTTYESVYSPDEYVAQKESLKWAKSKLDTSRHKYQETHYGLCYERADPFEETFKLAKPFTWQNDTEEVKKELRTIYRTPQSTYHRLICAPRIPLMKTLLNEGKMWKDPLDKHSLRRY